MARALLVSLAAFAVTILCLGVGRPATVTEPDGLRWPESWIPMGERAVDEEARMIAWISDDGLEGAVRAGMDHFEKKGLDPVSSKDSLGALLRFEKGHYSVIISFSPAEGGGTEISALFRPRPDKGVTQ